MNTIPDLAKVLDALRALESHPAVKAYLALVASLERKNKSE